MAIRHLSFPVGLVCILVGVLAWAEEMAHPAKSAPPHLLSRTADSLEFNWAPPATDHGDPITGYRVQRREDMGSWTGECRNATGLVCSVHELSPDTNHTFRIRASNNTGRGDWSQEVTFSTLPREHDAYRCTADNFTGCVLANRFAISVRWHDAEDHGKGVITDASQDNIEFELGSYRRYEKMIVQVTDTCQLSGAFKVDVFTVLDNRLGWSVTVVDTKTGRAKEYFSSATGRENSTHDEQAFLSCDV